MTPLPGEKPLPNVLPNTTATQVPLRRLQRTMDARHLIMIDRPDVVAEAVRAVRTEPAKPATRARR